MNLRRTCTDVRFATHRDQVGVSGKFTGANGSVGTILAKGNFTILYIAEGVYDIKLLAADGTSALKGFHIKTLNLIPVAPASTDGLSGPWEITTDGLNANGLIRVTTRNQAFAAADIIGVCFVYLEISPEAAS